MTSPDFGLYRSEIALWEPPEDLTVSEWADQYRILDPITSAEPGPWRTDRTPYLREILNSYSDPSIEQITIIASTQVAKTETQLNILGYIIDQDPGPTLFVMPREDDAKKMATRRFLPMVESSPRLAQHLSSAKSDRKTIEYRLGNALVSFAWANSPAALASTPARNVLLDEVDKYPLFSGKEADPISLATERQRTFWNRKRVITSTPTTRDGYIHREWATSTRSRYHVPCARCGTFQVLVFPQVRWPKDIRDPALIRRERLAVYVCTHCNGEIGELEKPKMLAEGVWCPDGCTVDDSGRIRGKRPVTENAGFHLSALYSPWLTFSEVGAKFLEAKDDPPRLLNFVNSWLGEPWEEKGEEISPEYLATRAAPHARGEVPAEALVLTAGVDVQDAHLYYAIRAWGTGETSWLVQADRVETWDELLEVLARTHYPVSGRTGEAQRVRRVCMDSGHRTDEVYQISRQLSDLIRPVKGQQKIAGGIPIRMSRVERNFQGQMARTGVKLWHLDTSYFKDKLARLIRTPLESPGAWRVHDDPALEYLRQVASEHKVIRLDRKTGRTSSVWTNRPGFGGNHWLDCEVYALAAADMLGVWRARPEPAAGEEREEAASNSAPSSEPEPPGPDRAFDTGGDPAPSPRRRRDGWMSGMRDSRRGRGGWVR